MNVENMKDLAKVRYERAVELAEEAQDLLDDGHYKYGLDKKDFSKHITEIFFLLRHTGR